jgi:hypothetical protein
MDGLEQRESKQIGFEIGGTGKMKGLVGLGIGFMIFSLVIITLVVGLHQTSNNWWAFLYLPWFFLSAGMVGVIIEEVD